MRYFKNTSWLFVEKILRVLVSLLVSVWVARYLGPEQFGLFSYVVSFVGIFAVVASLGLDGVVVRELVKNESRADDLIGTAFWLKFFGALCVIVLLAVSVKFTSNDSYTNTLVCIVAGGIIFQSFNVVDFYFQSKVLSKFAVYANATSLVVSSFVRIALILNEAPLIAFVWVVVFDGFVLACGYSYFYIKNNSSFKIQNLKFNKLTAVYLLKDSWPLILSSAVLMLQSRIDQVMLKEMVGNAEVGYYSVAMRLIEVFSFIPLVLRSSLFPSIQNTKEYSAKLYQDRLLNFYRLNFVMFLMTAIPIFFFAEYIVVLLFGVEYQPAGVLFALMATRLFFANMGVARGAYILAENLMKFSLVTMVLGTLVNIALNYMWIGEYGGEGAVVATICSSFVTVFLIDMFYSKTRNNVFLQLKSIITFYKISIRR